MKKAIVLANGNLSAPDIIKGRLEAWKDTDTLVIAADGGVRHAKTLSLTLNAVVGDLDSLEEATQQKLAQQGVIFEQMSPHKDEIDLELALLYALGQGCETIAGIGWLGGRLDMTLANLLVLAHPHLSAMDIQVWSDSQTGWLIRPPGASVSGHPGDTLSLIPLGGDAQGVSAQHVEYPLDNETLEFGPARGVSNVMTAPQALIEVREGLLLAVHTPGRPE